MITITYNNASYHIKLRQVKASSNYTLGVSVFFQSDKRPLFGTIQKVGTPAHEVLQWAEQTIKSKTNPYFKNN